MEMTRDEALKVWLPIIQMGVETMPECKEALDMAIKALAQEPTTKNDLGVDCVARQDVERFIEGFINEYTPEEELEFINLELDGLKHLPPVTPQELKPMVEIDLYSVIKQKYIEREILDKIRAEITDCLKTLDEIEKSGLNIYLPNEISGRRLTYQQCLEFIDKYKAESEDT